MEIPQIKNGKKPEDPFNVKNFFWLPPDTPYGNLQKKLFKIIMRVDELNRQIINSFSHWQKFRKQNMDLSQNLEKHIYSNEYFIYQMRRIADELISLHYLLEYYQENNQYPEEIEKDMIGKVLGKEDFIFKNHNRLLKKLNSISNAFKHSFINDDLSLIGSEEPCVHALYLRNNKLKARAEFYNVSLKELIIQFEEFYSEAMNWLKNFSESHKPHNNPQ